MELKLKDYIPELSEARMVRRAPEKPFPLGEEDAVYVAGCLHGVEAAFGVTAFPGYRFEQIPGRTLIKHFIDWWRGLEAETEAQHEALGRLPSAIRLLDTVSSWLEEQKKG